MNKAILGCAVVISCSMLLRNFQILPENAEAILADIDVPSVTAESVEEYGPPKIIKIASDVYVAMGYAFSTVTMFIGRDGVVIVDTTESVDAAANILQDFRKITKKPIKAIIYTHHHADHTSGAKAFVEEGSPIPEVLAHKDMLKEDQKLLAVAPAYLRRGAFQFGNKLPDALRQQVFSGATRLDYLFTADGLVKSGKLRPTRYLEFEDQVNVTLAGLNLTILHIPGETGDQIGIWYPEKSILLAADDIHKAFPNIYAIRGTAQRDVNEWINSVRRMAELRPRCLLFGHCNPVCDDAKVYNILMDYAAGMQFVHDQTVRYINKGLHPHEIAHKITLPAELATQPYLYELYGTLQWSVRGIYDMYIGWFSGEAQDLDPISPVDRSQRMIDLVGSSTMLEAARSALKENDDQWALELATHVFHDEPTHSEAQMLRRLALKKLASLQTSSNGRHFLMSTILKDSGILVEERSELLMSTLPLRALFHAMKFQLNAEKLLKYENITGCFQFTDEVALNKIYVHLHKGILEIISGTIKNPTFAVRITEETFKRLLTTQLSIKIAIEQHELSIIKGINDFQRFMSYFS